MIATENNTLKTVKGFSKAYRSLPANMLFHYRKIICERIGWKVSTFRAKCNGKRDLKPLEREYLETFFAEHGIEF